MRQNKNRTKNKVEKIFHKHASKNKPDSEFIIKPKQASSAESHIAF